MNMKHDHLCLLVLRQTLYHSFLNMTVTICATIGLHKQPLKRARDTVYT